MASVETMFARSGGKEQKEAKQRSPVVKLIGGVAAIALVAAGAMATRELSDERFTKDTCSDLGHFRADQPSSAWVSWARKIRSDSAPDRLSGVADMLSQTEGYTVNEDQLSKLNPKFLSNIPLGDQCVALPPIPVVHNAEADASGMILVHGPKPVDLAAAINASNPQESAQRLAVINDLNKDEELKTGSLPDVGVYPLMKVESLATLASYQKLMALRS